MSDIFARLVAHAGRAIDVARPRPVARFEPQAAQSRESDIEQVVKEPRTTRNSVEESAPENAALRTSERATVRDGTPRADLPQSAPADVRPAPHPTVRPPQVDVHTLVDPTAQAQREPSGSTSHDAPAATRPRVIVERIVERTVTREASTERTTALPTIARPGNAAPPFERPPVALRPASTAAVRRASLEPPVRAHDQADAAGDEMNGRRDVTIEVTIGRVDVRAVMPAAPAGRPAAARGPEVSLEEYLKRRSGGRS